MNVTENCVICHDLGTLQWMDLCWGGWSWLCDDQDWELRIRHRQMDSQRLIQRNKNLKAGWQPKSHPFFCYILLMSASWAKKKHISCGPWRFSLTKKWVPSPPVDPVGRSLQEAAFGIPTSGSGHPFHHVPTGARPTASGWTWSCLSGSQCRHGRVATSSS